MYSITKLQTLLKDPEDKDDSSDDELDTGEIKNTFTPDSIDKNTKTSSNPAEKLQADPNGIWDESEVSYGMKRNRLSLFWYFLMRYNVRHNTQNISTLNRRRA